MDRTAVPASSKSSAAPAKSRWTLPRLPLLIGMVGLGGAVTTGVLVKQRAGERAAGEIQGIKAELAALSADAVQYRTRFDNLRWNAGKLRGASEAAIEPLKSWENERARRFDALVAKVNREAEEKRFAQERRAIEALCARGDVAGARERLLRMPVVKFPAAEDFRRLQQEVYFKPLGEFSRQNPGYFKVWQEKEPEAAKADVEALRRELAAAPVDLLTPQLLLKYELLSAVAPADDPVLADWAAVVAAPDYFENPDAETLARWRTAQRAARAGDAATAVAQMQSIVKSKVRTRQPFRAAYGRAILRNSPDDVATAYPYLEEAALEGDAAARSWVAEQDLQQGRYGAALRWSETAVMAGDATAVPAVLALYAMKPGEVPREAGRALGVLNRITQGPDAPALAWVLLARLYDNGEGVPASAAKALACYRRAAEKEALPAAAELARRHLHGEGATPDPDAAREWAARAYAAGERDISVAVLTELMERVPDKTAAAVQHLLEHEQTVAPAGFQDTRTTGPGVAKLQLLLARFLDQKGSFGAAAKFYERSGAQDAEAASRHAELTTAHACESCAGTGKVQTSTPCPTCAGKGTVLCPACDGRGHVFKPGAPPCTTCGGSGSMVQEGRAVSCSACGGSGKGKGSVTKQECAACARGRIACRECTGGRIKLMKECPDCHGSGSRALADR